MDKENELSNLVIKYAIEVHSNLGPGLLESAYEACLFYELYKSGLKVERQKSLELKYKDISLDCGYRLDLLVENTLIVEVKAIEKLENIHTSQILTYLKLLNKRLGLLINFNNILLKDGIKRIIN